MRSVVRPILFAASLAIMTSLLMYVPVSSIQAQELTAQIIGGRPAPSLVQGPVALILTGRSACSGVLVGSQTVLTAGHCTESAAIDDYRILVGGRVYRITTRTTHPLYDMSATARASAPYDVGVIQLDGTPSITPLPVFIDRRVIRGTELTIAGYGTHESSAEALEPEDLARIGRSVVDSVSRDGVLLQEHAGGRASTCPGDSGGPAILRDSGYSGVVGTLSIGTNQATGDNCELVAGGLFGHVYLQSATVRQFLSSFPDIQYISGFRIFIETAARSSVTILRRTSRTSSISALRNSTRNVISSVSKAREYADGIRFDLLSQALAELRSAMRSKRLAQAKSRIGAARKRLDEVVTLGVY